MLKRNQTLLTFNADDTAIGDSGATSIAEALALNRSLTTLSLRNNSITNKGLHAVVECMDKAAASKHSALALLDLSENAKIKNVDDEEELINGKLFSEVCSVQLRGDVPGEGRVE